MRHWSPPQHQDNINKLHKLQKIVFVKPIWLLRIQRNPNVLKSRPSFWGEWRSAVAFTFGGVVGGRGIGQEWADLTDWDPKEASYRVSCTFLPPFGPSLHWVKGGSVLKLDRRGELNEIPLRHSRPWPRLDSSCQWWGQDHREEKRSKCREPGVILKSQGDALQLKKLTGHDI